MTIETAEKVARNEEETYDVIVIGAGAAGVGVAITLMHAGIENFLVVDRERWEHHSLLGQQKHDSSPHHSRAIQLECWI